MSLIIRLARIEDEVYAERVPGWWVLVAHYKDFQESNTNTKIYLVQHALVHEEDFEYDPAPEEIIS